MSLRNVFSMCMLVAIAAQLPDSTELLQAGLSTKNNTGTDAIEPVAGEDDPSMLSMHHDMQAGQNDQAKFQTDMMAYHTATSGMGREKAMASMHSDIQMEVSDLESEFADMEAFHKVHPWNGAELGQNPAKPCADRAEQATQGDADMDGMHKAMESEQNDQTGFQMDMMAWHSAQTDAERDAAMARMHQDMSQEKADLKQMTQDMAAFHAAQAERGEYTPPTMQ